jgi:creatinine amidohydrolase
MRWADATAPELREAASAGAVCLWPIGTTEQHGSHLVTGMDLRAAVAVCEQALGQVRGARIVLLPPLPFGASSHWLPLGATLSLSSSTLTGVILDVAGSVASSGFARLVIVNGHAGNIGPGVAAVGAWTDPRVVIEFTSYWTLVDATELASRCAVDDGGVGHAGEVETAIAMHLGDDVFRGPLPTSPGRSLLDGGPGARFAPFARAPRPAEEAPSGVYGDPRPARPELGAFVIHAAAASLARHLEAVAAPPVREGTA